MSRVTRRQESVFFTHQLKSLRARGEFSDFVLVAWGAIEFYLEKVVLSEYHLDYESPMAEPLTNLSFGRKLTLQKRLGYLNSSEYRAIMKFQEKRNRLFHKHGLFATYLAESEKKDVMEIGMKAVLAMEELLNRAYAPKFPTRTSTENSQRGEVLG